MKISDNAIKIYSEIIRGSNGGNIDVHSLGKYERTMAEYLLNAPVIYRESMLRDMLSRNIDGGRSIFQNIISCGGSDGIMRNELPEENGIHGDDRNDSDGQTEKSPCMRDMVKDRLSSLLSVGHLEVSRIRDSLKPLSCSWRTVLRAMDDESVANIHFLRRLFCPFNYLNSFI